MRIKSVIAIDGSLLRWTHCLILLTSLSASILATEPWGFDTTGMDRRIAPGDDFDGFANGDWKARVEVPADRSSIGTFANLRDDATIEDRALIESLPGDAAARTQNKKLADLYRSFMDEDEVETRGERPIETTLVRIRRVQTKDELAETMGASKSGLGASFVALEFGADRHAGTRYELNLQQGGLRLSRDFYLGSQQPDKLSAYRAYVTQLLSLVEWPQPAESAAQIVKLETQIAAASWPAADVRDPRTTFNPMTPSQLATMAPNFPWEQFLRGARIDKRVAINVTTPSSLTKIADIFATTPLPLLKAWTAFRSVDDAAPYLSSSFVEARFDFDRVMGGPAVQPLRWKRGVALVNDAMGAALGELYAAHHLSRESQSQARTLVENLRKAFSSRIQAAQWMSPATQREALRKLAALEIQVGAPKRFIDYSSLNVARDDLLGNVMRARAFDWKRRVTQAHGEWNKNDWRFWPQYPTAYNENRQLIFTAALLQPPFFDPHADTAINYGALGAVIGHELSHNFDDQGRSLDADGRQRDWGMPADAEHFKAQAHRLVEQFSAMQITPDLRVNGALTLGENIADLAGLSIALQAYHDSLNGKPAPDIDGLTGDQPFFLGWAQLWRQKDRPEHLRELVLSDVHSPPFARINGPLRNLDAWYRAWEVKPSQKLYLDPDQRVRIW